MMNILMINRKIKYFLSVIMVFFTLLVYGQERPKMERFLTIKPTYANFNAEGGSKTFTVSASGTWKISSSKGSWMHLSKNGNTLTVRVDENTGTSSRSGSFELTSGEKSVRVSVKQAGGDISLSVSSENVSFGSSGGTKTITVTTNGTWQIGTNSTSWGHLTKNGNQISIKTDKNDGISQRSGSFTIKAGNQEKRVYISQSGSSTASTNLTVSSDNLQFDSYGGTQTITISSNGSWQIGTNIAPWGHLTKSGNQLSIKIDSNPNTTSRLDWITIKAGNKEKRINISQSGSTVSQSEGTTSIGKAEIENVTVSHKETVNGESGMKINFKLTIKGKKGKNCRVVAYFYDEYGNSLKDTNNKYNAIDGQVCAYHDITPLYESSEWKSLDITIPYSELHLSGYGTKRIKFNFNVWDESVSPSKSIMRTGNISTSFYYNSSRNDYNYTYNRSSYRSHRRIQKASCGYLQAGYQTGTMTGVGVMLGGYIQNFNMEVSAVYGLKTSEDIYWNYNGRDDKHPLSLSYRPITFGVRTGYGVIIGTRLRLTPQVGATYLSVNSKGGDSKSYAISANAGMRVDLGIVPHLSIFATPEMSFAVSKSTIYKQLETVSPNIKGWKEGFNANFGLCVYF